MFPNTKSFQLPQLNTQETKKIGKNKKDKKEAKNATDGIKWEVFLNN